MHTATKVNMTKAPQCRVLFVSARTYRRPGKAPNAWKHKVFLVQAQRVQMGCSPSSSFIHAFSLFLGGETNGAFSRRNSSEGLKSRWVFPL